MGARSVNRDTSLRRNVQEGIDCIWPDGIVEMSPDPDESYFIELHPKLSRALRRIRNRRLVYEREADGGPVWWEESDPEEDPPDDIDRSRSYHTFSSAPWRRLYISLRLSSRDDTHCALLGDMQEPHVKAISVRRAECG